MNLARAISDYKKHLKKILKKKITAEMMESVDGELGEMYFKTRYGAVTVNYDQSQLVAAIGWHGCVFQVKFEMIDGKFLEVENWD